MTFFLVVYFKCWLSSSQPDEQLYHREPKHTIGRLSFTSTFNPNKLLNSCSLKSLLFCFTASPTQPLRLQFFFSWSWSLEYSKGKLIQMLQWPLCNTRFFFSSFQFSRDWRKKPWSIQHALKTAKSDILKMKQTQRSCK